MPRPGEDEPGTMAVELVELDDGAAPRRGPGPRSVFAGAVTALLGLIALTGHPARPTEPPADPFPTAVGQATARPVLLAATPSPPPDSPFPWAWTSFESRGFGRGAIAANLWVVGGLFVAEIETDDGPDGGPYGPVSSVLVTSTDGTAWDDVSLPTAEFAIETGTVVEDRLVLIGRVGTDVAAPLQLWSTDGGTWRREPDPVGLTSVGGYVAELAGDCLDAAGCEAYSWAATIRAPNRSVSEDLLVSRDGVRWERPGPTSFDEMPDRQYAAGSPTFVGLTRHGGRWYVVRSYVANTSLQVFTDVADSSDGEAWSVTRVSATTGGGHGLAAGAAGLVLVGREDRGSLRWPVAWLSGDGTAWAELEADMLPGRLPAAMDLVVPTDHGYVSMNQQTGDAWVSMDGESWRNLPAFLAEAGDSVAALAYSDDVLLAAGRSAAGRPAFWRTSLSDLIATP